jgi:hypothetical protein
MSQIGAWLENLRNQERRSYGPVRAFFVQKTSRKVSMRKARPALSRAGESTAVGIEIDECALQRIEAKNVGKEPEEKEQPTKWGVVSRIPLPSETDRWQQVPTTRPEDKSRSPRGVVNMPIDW